MLAHLLYYLFFETVQPSYATLQGLVPEELIVSAAGHELGLADRHQPIKKGESTEPVVQAQAIFAVDLNTGIPLLVRNVFFRRKVASITKLVTAMVILDRHGMQEKVTVSRHAANQEPSTMRLRPGEEMTIENLLTGLLINSANDAAVALAEADAGSEAAFITKMNEKALELGLKDTHFSSVMGFDEPDNYSTAYDTMIFARAALRYPFIRKTVSQKNADVTDTAGKIPHHLASTNELLENPYYKVVGLKTGSTPQAGQSFVSLTEAPHGHEILMVLLDSPDRFKETKIALDWILRNFDFPLP